MCIIARQYCGLNSDLGDIVSLEFFYLPTLTNRNEPQT